MYRPEWYQAKSGGASVLALAQTMHEIMSGSADGSDKTVQDCAECLRWVLDNWKEPLNHKQYDNAVKLVLLAAWREYEEYIR